MHSFVRSANAEVFLGSGAVGISEQSINYACPHRADSPMVEIGINNHTIECERTNLEGGLEERLGVLREPLGEAGEESPEEGAFRGPISFLWLL